MTSRRAKLHEDTNFRLMRILEADSDLSQREMGKALTSGFLKRKMEEYEALKLEIVTFKSEIEAKNGEKPHSQ
jgi:hypothetical protein